MHVGQDGWLVEDASGLPALTRVPTVRTTSLEEPQPLGLCWHWSGGPALGPLFATELANSIRTYDKVRDAAASWHVLVAKNGRLIQSVSLTQGSWHVGRPGRIGAKPTKTGGKWDPAAWTGGKLYANVNRVLVGVELENSGKLLQLNEKFYCWPYYMEANKPASGPNPKWRIPDDRAKLYQGEWYDDFPEAQRSAATRLLQALATRFRWTRDVSQYGHLMFDSGRKEDPGPLWMEEYLPAILDSVFGAEVVKAPAQPVVAPEAPPENNDL